MTAPATSHPELEQLLHTRADYMLGSARTTAHVANEFFASHGLGRPVDAADHTGRVCALLVDGVIRGAAYAAAATSVSELMFFTGTHHLGAPVLFGLEAIAVDAAFRHQGVGRQLLRSTAAHARRDSGASALLARIAAGDHELQNWYRHGGFTVCEPDQHLRIGELTLPRSEGYVDSWLDLGA